MMSSKPTYIALKARRFLTPKHEHAAEECEDAIGINFAAHRFAVADGATEAFDAGNWSRRLVQNWSAADGLLNRSDFWSFIETEARAINELWKQQQLSWYSENKQQIGSFAAFVGVELEFAANNPQWNAIALGDSCLIHCRGNAVLKAFPLSESLSFGNSPILAPTSAERNFQASNNIVTASGQLMAGDELFLFSDAISAWFLMLSEQNDEETMTNFKRVLDDDDDAAVAQFIEDERSSGRLKNDDVAIIRLMF